MPKVMTRRERKALLQKGLTALRQKKASEARVIFEAIAEKSAGNASVWIGIAYACRDMGDTPAMLAAADRAIAIEPTNARAFVLKADHYAAKDDRRAAAAFYRQALAVAPPVDQIADDLKAELVRAHRKTAEIMTDFERHLTEKINQKINDAGTEGQRFKHSFEIMTGRRQPGRQAILYPPKPRMYFFPDLPVVQFHKADDTGWLHALEAATDTIRRELFTVMDSQGSFVPYVTGADNRPQSDPHGMKDNDDWSAFYLWKDGTIIPDHAALCPETVRLVKKIPLPTLVGRSPNILFSRLRTGARIPPHHGFLNTRLIGHLPLIVPQDCGFRVGSETRCWQEGKVWLFDDTIEHEAWNDSPHDRYILLFEVWRPELTAVEQKLIQYMFKVRDGYI